MKELENDGLLAIDEKWLIVTMKGRLLVRNICMIFDRYLGMASSGRDSSATTLHYSKTI